MHFFKDLHNFAKLRQELGEIHLKEFFRIYMQTKFINRHYKHCDAENAAIYPNKMNKDKLLAKILLRVLFFYYIED